MTRTFLAFSLGLVLAGAALPAAALADPGPPIGTPRAFVMPAVEKVALGNGMTLALVPFGSVPQTTLRFEAFAGDLNAPGRPWTTATLVELMKQGAGGRDAAALARDLSDMGGSLTATGGQESISLSTTVLSDRTADAIALLSDVVRRPNFAAADHERVMANQKRNLAQSLASPQTMADTLLAQQLFGDRPWAERLPTAAQLEALSLADLKAFHAAQLGAARSTLFVVGRFDREAVIAAAKRAFGDWAAGPARSFVPADIAAGPTLVLADRPDSKQTTIRLAFAAPAAGTADDVPTRVLDALLGGSFGSRITNNLREDKGYTYSPGSLIEVRPNAGVWIWQGDITPEVTGKAMAEVFGEIRKVQSELAPATEAEAMKTYTSTYLLMRSTDAQLIASQLVRAERLGLSNAYLNTYVQRAMAVTPEDIRARARTFDVAKMVVVAVGDMKSVAPQLLALPEFAGAKVERVTLGK